MTNICSKTPNLTNSLPPKDADDFQLLDRKAAASLLNISLRQLMYLKKREDGIPFIRLGGKVLFEKQSLINYVRSRETNSLKPSDVSQGRETGISSLDTFQNPPNDSEVNGGNDE